MEIVQELRSGGSASGSTGYRWRIMPATLQLYIAGTADRMPAMYRAILIKGHARDLSDV